MPIRVRPAESADVAVICDFNARLAQESEGKTLDPKVLHPGVTAVLADPNKGRYFVAEENARVVGQLGVTLEWSDWRNGWFWWIQSVYVHADARRRGVFRALFEHVRMAAKNDPHVIGIRLYVDHDNHAAQETYQALGMTRTGYQVMEQYPLG